MKHLINWVEIPTLQLERAQRFYQAVLDVEFHRMDLGPSRYALFPTDDRFNAGALVQGDGYVPTSEGVVIYLDGGTQMATLVDRVAAAGGTVLLPKTFLSSEAGFIALFLDSEGNKIGLQSLQ